MNQSSLAESHNRSLHVGRLEDSNEDFEALPNAMLVRSP